LQANKRMTHHHIKLIMKFWITVILLGGAIICYLRFVDGTLVRPLFSGVDYRQGITYQTTKDSYTAGENVYVYSLKFCKLRQVEATTNWTLRDHVLLAYAPASSNVAASCYEAGKYVLINLLPKFLPDGKYFFEGTITYKVNPLRTISIPIKTNEFEINQVIKTLE